MKIFEKGDIVHYTQKKGRDYIYKTGIFRKYTKLSSGTVVLLMEKEVTAPHSPYVGGDLVYPSEVEKKVKQHKRRKL